MRSFRFNLEKLPRIVNPWDVVGEVTEETAKDFGLAPGTIVAAGCGDTAASALGGGIVHAGMLFDVAGTAAVLAGCTDQFVADETNRALLTMRSVIPGLWNPLAYIAGGGIALRWFRDQFYNQSRGEALELPSDMYREMIAKAAEVASRIGWFVLLTPSWRANLSSNTRNAWYLGGIFLGAHTGAFCPLHSGKCSL